VEELFATFDAHLRDNGFMAMKGQIVDASIVNVPKQRNSREENARIKEGDIPEDWPENKRRRKDVDARWTKKNGKSFYGYKNHVSVDVKHKLIRSYAVTDAALHDSKVFEQLLVDNTSKDPFADRAHLWCAGPESGEFAVAYDRYNPSPSKNRFAQPGVQH